MQEKFRLLISIARSVMSMGLLQWLIVGAELDEAVQEQLWQHSWRTAIRLIIFNHKRFGSIWKFMAQKIHYKHNFLKFKDLFFTKLHLWIYASENYAEDGYLNCLLRINQSPYLASAEY